MRLNEFLIPSSFYDQQGAAAARDEYKEYYKAPPLLCDRPLQWWEARREEYPILSKMGLDFFSRSLISVESESAFLSAKPLVTGRRNGLA